MSSDRDTTRIVRSWLEDGVTILPDRVLDGVLEQLPATPQRRSFWLGRPLDRLDRNRRLAMAAAAVVVVGLLGFELLPAVGPPIGGRPSPSPTASPGPTAQASPTEPVETPLPAGRHSLNGFPVGVSFTVPEGWVWCVVGPQEQGVCPAHGNGAVQFLIVANVVAEACAPTLRNPPVGPSVEALVSALSGLAGVTATAPIDISVDGYAGKQFTLTAPNRSGCDFFSWATADRLNILGGANLVRIVDVDGTRVVMSGPYPPRAPDAPEAIATMEQIMDSVIFTP
jgi:hypothetical protein